MEPVVTACCPFNKEQLLPRAWEDQWLAEHCPELCGYLLAPLNVVNIFSCLMSSGHSLGYSF